MWWSPPTRWPRSGRPACWDPCTWRWTRRSGKRPRGRLQPGATHRAGQVVDLSVHRADTVLAVGRRQRRRTGQIGDIIHNFNAALSGREEQIRDLLTRLDKFVGMLDRQRDNIIASITALNRLAGTFAGQSDVITKALQQDTARTGRADQGAAAHHHGAGEAAASSATPPPDLINDTQADLVNNLQNLEPTMRALADVGPDLGNRARLRAGVPVHRRTSSTGRSGATT